MARASAPVSGDPVVAAALVRPMSRYPPRVCARRAHLVTRDPDIRTAVPPLIAWRPDMARTDDYGPLDDWSGRRHPNVDDVPMMLRMRRRGDEQRADHQCAR